jgi:protein-tyrosine phosphatase
MPRPPFKLLFVCLGNICRSPAAEGVMRRIVQREGMEHQVVIDSAGTAGWHAGKLADLRMRAAAADRGLDLTHRARQVLAADLRDFDLVLAMDRENLQSVLALDPAGEFKSSVLLFCEFCTRHTQREVPDPYYGGAEGFALVLDLLEDGCEGVLEHICEKRAPS